MIDQPIFEILFEDRTSPILVLLGVERNSNMAWTYGDHDLEDFRVISAAQLCSYEDIDFIRRAYVAILGRFPDPEGERYYLSRLRAGYSKIHVAGQLCKSRGDTSVSLAGLQRMLRKHRNASLYGLRWLSRLMGYSEGNSASERHNRALLRELAGIRERIGLLCSTGIHSAPSVQHESAAAQQSLISKGQQLTLPLSTDSRTRRLADALNREVQFKTRAL